MDDLTKASNQFNLPQHIITLVSNDSGYALDDQNEVFYLLLHVNSSNACALSFDYNSLIDAEVKEFNSDSGTARKIGRAVVGDVLFGDVGAIVGAVSTSALYNVELIIKTTNLKNPSNIYTLCSYAKQGSIAYESAHYFGEKIVAVVNNIAKQYHGSIGAGKSPNIDPDHIDATITRIELFLEDKEWQEARTYCDGALDYAPDNSMLYLLRCCANEHQSSLHDLIVYSDLNQNTPDYIKALRFADAELKETLDNYGQERKCEDTYNKAIFVLDTGDDALQKKDIENSANAFIQGRNLLVDISDYKNARSLISDCQDKLYKIASDKDNNDIKSVEIAQRCLRELGKYQKTDELISYYDYKNQEFKKITDHANSLLKEDWSSFNDTYEILKTLEECLRIGDHEDADKLQAYVNSITGREREYAKASQLLKGKKLSALIKAKDILSAYPDYKNTQELLLTCNDKIQLIENYNKKKKQKWIIISLAFVILLSIFIVISRVIYPSILYKNGVQTNNKHSELQLYAHRGFSKEAPDDSLAGFELAAANSYGLDCDLWPTKEDDNGGIDIVVSHDNNLMKVAGIDCNITEMTVDEVTRLKIKSGSNIQEYPDEHIPTLEEVLSIAERYKCRVLVEMKGEDWTDEQCYMLLDCLNKWDMLDKTIVNSLYINNLKRFLACAQDYSKTPDTLYTILYYEDFTEKLKVAEDNQVTMVSIRSSIISDYHDEIIPAVEQSGLRIHTWTAGEVDEKAAVDEMEKYGVYSISTDTIIKEH